MARDDPPRTAHAYDDADVEADETTRLLGSDNPPHHQNGNGAGVGTSDSPEDWDGYKDFEGLPWWRKPSVFWLLGPFIMFTLAFGGVMVPKLNLITSLVCRQYFAERASIDPTQPVVPVFVGGDNPQCTIPEVQSRVSTFFLAMNLVTGLLSAIVAPRLGRLSDRWGRTRLMGFASLGGLMGEIITVVIANFADRVDYRWLILGSIFDGATGSFTAGSILTQSYTSDSTPPSKRAVYIGYTHACLFTGLAFGPLLAGYFVKWTGSLLSVFYVIVACHAAFILIVTFVVPESLVKRRRLLAQEKWAKEKSTQKQSMGTWLSRIQTTNPFEPLAVLWPQGPGTSLKLRINLVCLAIADAIILGSSIAVGAVIILYSEKTWHWGTLESSQFISALSLVRVVTLLLLFPAINYFARRRAAQQHAANGTVSTKDKHTGANRLDISIIRIALFSEILGCVGYILARDSKIFFLSGMVTALGGLGGATVQAVVTKHVPQSKVGQVLGAIGMLHALARVVGPVVFNGIYSATVGVFDQAFFFVLTSIFVFAFVASFFIRPRVAWNADDEDETAPVNRPGAGQADDPLADAEDQQVIVR